MCGLSVAFDGYDLVVFGATVPSLLAEWRIGPAEAGTLGSYALIGMLIGAAPILIVVPLALRYLPESLESLVLRGETAKAEALATRLGVSVPEITRPAKRSWYTSVSELAAPGFRTGTVLLWLARTGSKPVLVVSFLLAAVSIATLAVRPSIAAILGPILAGLVIASGAGFAWNFYLFATVAVAGLLAVALVPLSPALAGERLRQAVHPEYKERTA
ncbi:hypothetical protein [Nonomuraea sp. NPDC049480]|uniref:hypothetical protein n=1 Tax=Nonomuraea sp. NPDC049480 TaxID=3364353 RepID=UPI00379D7AB4